MQNAEAIPPATENLHFDDYDPEFYENNEDKGKDILGTGSCFLRKICLWYDCRANKCLLYKKGDTNHEQTISSRILEIFPTLSEKKQKKLQNHPYFSRFLPKD